SMWSHPTRMAGIGRPFDIPCGDSSGNHPEVSGPIVSRGAELDLHAVLHLDPAIGLRRYKRERPILSDPSPLIPASYVRVERRIATYVAGNAFGQRDQPIAFLDPGDLQQGRALPRSSYVSSTTSTQFPTCRRAFTF